MLQIIITLGDAIDFGDLTWQGRSGGAAACLTVTVDSNHQAQDTAL